MGLSIWQILIIAVVAILLFGRGRISDLMGDVAKGIKSFKKGMAEDDEEDEAKPANKTIDHQASDTVSPKQTEDQTKTTG
ncbi:sec-independent protein translocase protein TatA [Breoghania corrubedonensis]|uniref:Sec-independent protein translocase protein TatA n=1 Tax=Breoghania corrubedonensis TaxID=665038 RepID=A0A2T5V8G7_9HYPH|nr:twin-arginine translocase TatA/TatE family subunit [Breoghania corrubedonensis]PTW60042.1 sec-independent protein translocase protein TatA [Breoghania corrubedonensis]